LANQNNEMEAVKRVRRAGEGEKAPRAAWAEHLLHAAGSCAARGGGLLIQEDG
jgi:hypothetical protein